MEKHKNNIIEYGFCKCNICLFPNFCPQHIIDSHESVMCEYCREPIKKTEWNIIKLCESELNRIVTQRLYIKGELEKNQ